MEDGCYVVFDYDNPNGFDENLPTIAANTIGEVIEFDRAEEVDALIEKQKNDKKLQGLSGDQIPRVAQIIAVADTFDAMYSNRPYRKRMNFDKVVSIIQESSGTQLAPDVVDAFMRLVKKGEFRAPDDDGGGSMETIENIHAQADRKEHSES